MLSFSPSIVFATLNTGPWIASSFFIGSDLGYQYLFLSVVIFLVLLVADFIAYRTEAGPKIPEAHRLVLSNRMYYSLIFIILSSLIGNILLHGSIPLWDYLTSGDYVETRAFHAKSSKLYYYASYAINYCNMVLVPLLFFYILDSGKPKRLFFLIPILLFSASFYMSKFILIFLGLSVIGLYISVRFKVKLFRWIIVGLVILTVFSSHTYITDLDSSQSESDQKVYSIADLYRVHEGKGLKAYIDGKIYRIVWTPSDVSAIWYRYFIEHRQKSGFGYSVNYPNVVGVEYYKKRFQERYTNDLYAFASFEVDALVRFGWIGLFLAVLSWLVMRLLITRVAIQCGRGYLHGYLLLGTAVLLPISSMQAVTLSNGLLVAILAIFLFYKDGYVDFSVVVKKLGKHS